MPDATAGTVFNALRALGWVVLLLMIGSVLYIGWISLVNWDRIGV